MLFIALECTLNINSELLPSVLTSKPDVRSCARSACSRVGDANTKRAATRCCLLVENPPWTGWDVALLAVFSFLLIIISLLGVSYTLRRVFYPSLTWIDVVKQPEVIVGGQLVAYILVFALMYAFIAFFRRQHFFSAIQWNWPPAWGWYVLGGLALSIGLQLFARLLPIPKDLPMDQFFRTPRQAWLLSIFSVTLAPLIEELFFRGFLYPVLARRLGMVASVFLTALAFASIHGAQLTYCVGAGSRHFHRWTCTNVSPGDQEIRCSKLDTPHGV